MYSNDEYCKYGIFDNVEEYDNRDIVAGEYYVNKIIDIKKINVKLPQGFYPHNLIKFLL